jgi:hypothetical protein
MKDIHEIEAKVEEFCEFFNDIEDEAKIFSSPYKSKKYNLELGNDLNKFEELFENKIQEVQFTQQKALDLWNNDFNKFQELIVNFAYKYYHQWDILLDAFKDFKKYLSGLHRITFDIMKKTPDQVLFRSLVDIKTLAVDSLALNEKSITDQLTADAGIFAKLYYELNSFQVKHQEALDRLKYESIADAANRMVEDVYINFSEYED